MNRISLDLKGFPAESEMMVRGMLLLGPVLLPLALAGCAGERDDAPAMAAGHNRRTELRREHDCADSAWKAANLGLWYNICRPS